MTYTLLAIFSIDCSVCENFTTNGSLKLLMKGMEKLNDQVKFQMVNLFRKPDINEILPFSKEIRNMISWYPTFLLISEDNIERFAGLIKVDSILNWVTDIISRPSQTLDQKIASLRKLEREVDDLIRMRKQIENVK